MSDISLYEGVKAELEGLSYTKADGSTDSIKTVALWRNQPWRENKENPVRYPAAFIELMPANFMESSSKAHQTVDMVVRIHLCFESYKDEDLDVLLLKQSVYSALQGKRWSFWGKMKRRNEEKNFDHDNIQDFMQDFDASKGKDYGADERPSTEATISELDITTEIVDDLE